MKIAQIIYTGFGGLGSVAFSLAEADKQRRHEWIIGFIGDLPIDQSYPLRCAANGVAWQEFRSTPGRPYSAWLALARWLGRERPDAVILHTINSILPCRWYAWRHPVPLIAVEHKSSDLKTRSEWMASYLSMLLADQVVLLTPEYGQELAKAHGLLYRPDKIAIIANGIDTGAFHPATDRIRERGTVRLGMAARFSFSKRQDLLVETVSLLKAQKPEVNWQLSLAGDGDRYEAVCKLAAELGVEGIVQFEGLLDESQLIRWLRGLDIYVHASQGETLSTSLLQAMATGLPIVASDISGIANLIGRDESCGLLAPTDSMSFAKQIVRLTEDVEAMKDFSDRGRAVCQRQYSNAFMLQNYLALITELRGPCDET